MDRVNKYRRILKALVQDYAAGKISHGKIESQALCDPVNDHYQVVHIGWDGSRRIHAMTVHLQILNGKIWIQYDGTNRPVADALLEAGVPKEDIILGFQPEYVRQYTDFAVA